MNILQLWHETVVFSLILPVFLCRCFFLTHKCCFTFFPLPFHSIMYFLSGQIGLISITLQQNEINSRLTSLQGHVGSWVSTNRIKCLGALWNQSDYRSQSLCSGVFSNIHFLPHSSPIHFLQKVNLSPLTVNTRIRENYND